MRFLKVMVCMLVFAAMGSTVASAQEADTSSESADSTSGVPEQVITRVSNSFQNGDADLLLEQTADRIEVSLPGTRAYYSRSQAMYVLRAFFQEHDPTRFEIEDVSKAGASYFVTGRFWYSRSEQPMHVYTRFVSRSGHKLYEIRVEPLR
ncbi:DUF4783 domain-containing protein [Longibacter salinarum]|uniref:DUF4783 domain-containing protein n=1 Tax=Longibacter salinarum TaxID=1850348 RepID=A0A2A8D0W7_9BACT|nr:DUF4783 domain-containing protein [Longibacter salinarum]PEN14534.1 DUF4783 domain-containing protein [Longibacter salinarum]